MGVLAGQRALCPGTHNQCRQGRNGCNYSSNECYFWRRHLRARACRYGLVQPVLSRLFECVAKSTGLAAASRGALGYSDSRKVALCILRKLQVPHSLSIGFGFALAFHKQLTSEGRPYCCMAVKFALALCLSNINRVICDRSHLSKLRICPMSSTIRK